MPRARTGYGGRGEAAWEAKAEVAVPAGIGYDESRSDDLSERGFAEGFIKTAYEYGISERWILETLQKYLDISLQSAQEYVSRFGKQTV